MTENEKKICDFLRQIPDRLLLPEAARRMIARRVNQDRRPKTLRKCIFCAAWFGAAEMRKHVSAAHPGGLMKWQPARNRGRGEHCLYCDVVCSRQSMRHHVRAAHPEKCREETRKKPLILPPQPVRKVKKSKGKNAAQPAETVEGGTPCISDS
jgi:hypothetical protein